MPDRPTEVSAPAQAPERRTPSSLAALLARDPQSLGRLLIHYRPYLLAIANREIGPDLDAKVSASDIVQQACMEATRDVARFRGDTPSEFRSWLRAICLNKLGTILKKYGATSARGRERSLDATSHGGDASPDRFPAPSTLSPSGHVMVDENAEIVNRALQRLRQHDRQVLEWRVYEGLEWVEIARRSGGTIEAIRKAYSRAIDRLGEQIEKHASPQQLAALHEAASTRVA